MQYLKIENNNKKNMWNVSFLDSNGCDFSLLCIITVSKIYTATGVSYRPTYTDIIFIKTCFTTAWLAHWFILVFTAFVINIFKMLNKIMFNF